MIRDVSLKRASSGQGRILTVSIVLMDRDKRCFVAVATMKPSDSMCAMAIRFSEFRHYDQTISQPQMCVSLVRGNPVPLLFWFGGGLVLVRAQLNLNHIDEGLGCIAPSANG